MVNLRWRVNHSAIDTKGTDIYIVSLNDIMEGQMSIHQATATHTALDTSPFVFTCDGTKFTSFNGHIFTSNKEIPSTNVNQKYFYLASEIAAMLRDGRLKVTEDQGRWSLAPECMPSFNAYIQEKVDGRKNSPKYLQFTREIAVAGAYEFLHGYVQLSRTGDLHHAAIVDIGARAFAAKHAEAFQTRLQVAAKEKMDKIHRLECSSITPWRIRAEFARRYTRGY